MATTTEQLGSVEAEQAVLGACLIDPNAIYLCDGLKPEYFLGGPHSEDHATIFKALRKLAGNGQAPDFVTVSGELKQAGRLERSGGQGYLTYLIAKTPTSAHAEHYARRVQDAAIRRRLAQVAADIMAIAHNHQVDHPVAEAQSLLADLIDTGIRDEVLESDDLWSIYLEDYEARGQSALSVGLSTGFDSLDTIIGGLRSGELTVVAARPSMGKSVMVEMMAEHVAGLGKTVVFVSLEMDPRRGLADRRIRRWSGMNKRQIDHGENLGDVVRLVGEYAHHNIIYIDNPTLTTFRLRGHLKRLSTVGAVDLLVVDYIQLFADNVGDSEYAQVTYVSRQLNAMKLEFRIPVLAVSQLSRAVEQRVDRRPRLSDLRSSGQIEQDADKVIFIHRESMYDPDWDRDKPDIAEIIVAKHRNGPTGAVQLGYVPNQVSFVPLKLRGG